MNISKGDYYRKLTTNSFNQDFIYYKHLKQPSKSPKYKVHHKISHEFQNSNNHSKIQSLKNTLNTLFEPSSKIIEKNYNKSLIDYPTNQNKRKTEGSINSKSVHQEYSGDNNFNNRLQMLTSKLRQIAQKPHFTSYDHQQQKKQKKKKIIFDNNDEKYVKNLSIINKLYNMGDINSKTDNPSKFQGSNKNKKQDQLSYKKHNQSSNSQYLKNYSQELNRSKSKSSSSFYTKRAQELSNQISQNSSLKRQYKQLRNQKSVSTFLYHPQFNHQFEILQRPRGKTATNLVNAAVDQINKEPTKIKINSFLQNKTSQNKLSHKKLPVPFDQTQSKKSSVLKRSKTYLKYNTLGILQPHRADINSIIINSDGKRFLTASSDYTVKQSTLQGKQLVLRKHQGKVNTIRMIDDKLYSGGNDCRLRYQRGNFIFKSPVLEVYPHQRQFLNIGTSSAVELYNINKRITLNKIQVKTKFYKIYQKINKDVYFVDNHQLSIIDWRVPYPLINIYTENQFVNDWISDPYTLDFYLLQDKKLKYFSNSKQKHYQYEFDSQIKDYCWKKDKIYFLTDISLQIMQNKKNQFLIKQQCPLNQNIQSQSILQVKNNLWIYGTKNGKLVVNSFL